MQSTTTRRLNRRAAIIHPTVAVLLATLMATLAVLPHAIPHPLPAPIVTVATPDTWMVAAAVATTLALVGLIVGLNRRADR